MGETTRRRSNYEPHGNESIGKYLRDDIVAHGRLAKNNTIDIEDLYFGKEQDR